MNSGNSFATFGASETPAEAGLPRQGISRREPLAGAYALLLLFMVVYCARPGDWIPGLAAVPLAKITAILALLALAFSLLHGGRRLPREVSYLAVLVGQMFLAAAFSPVWRGGATQASLDFSKVLIVVVIMAVVVTTGTRLRRLIFVQAGSVALIALVTVWKGKLELGRLEGSLSGNYADPNDLALAIIISLPLCLALLFMSRSFVRKALWAIAMLVMLYAVFLTGSRGGFVALVAAAAALLWEFAVRGRRRYLVVVAAIVACLLWQFSGQVLRGRLKGTFNPNEDTAASYGSAEARQQLFWRSIEVTMKHPLFGVGPGNFAEISGSWHVTHNAFTEMSAEAGLPALMLYGLILWSGFKNVGLVKRWAKRQKDSNVLAKGLMASLVGYVVGSCFLSVGYNFLPYFLVAYTTALFLIIKKSSGRNNVSTLEGQEKAGQEALGVAEEGRTAAFAS